MSAADRLDAIDARANAATLGPWTVLDIDTSSGPHGDVMSPGTGPVAQYAGLDDADFIAASRQDVPALTAALRAVLDLHEQVQGLHPWCYLDGESWPCPTVRAVESALGGAE